MGLKPRRSPATVTGGAALAETLLGSSGDWPDDDDLAGWHYITAISRVRALTEPGDELGHRLRELHDEFCRSSQTAAELRERVVGLRALIPAASWHLPAPFELAEWSPHLVRSHCDTDGSIDGGDEATSVAIGRYGPAYLLAWTAVPAPLAPLLRVAIEEEPFDRPRLEAAIDAAVAAAREVYGNLAVELATLDFASPAAFARSYARALRDLRLVVEPPRPAPTGPAAPEPDWEREVDRLHALCVESLARFAGDHPDERLAQLIFDCDPPADYVLVSLDTASDYAARAVALANELRERRRGHAADPAGWRAAHWHIAPAPPDVHDPGDFEHQFFAEHDVVGLDAYMRSGNAPLPRDERDETYDRGQLRRLFFRVFDRLIEDGTLDTYPSWRPFRLGFAFHGEPPVVLFSVPVP